MKDGNTHIGTHSENTRPSHKEKQRSTEINRFRKTIKHRKRNTEARRKWGKKKTSQISTKEKYLTQYSNTQTAHQTPNMKRNKHNEIEIG